MAPLIGIDEKVFSIQNTENHECIRGLKRRLSHSPKTFNKLISIIDAPLNVAVNSVNVGLVYTRAGFLVGHSSIVPHCNIEYFWRTIAQTLIRKSPNMPWTPLEERSVLRTIGALVLWRISIRDEEWRVSFTESNKHCILTGKEIRIAQYWTKKIEPASIADLKNKFSTIIC